MKKFLRNIILFSVFSAFIYLLLLLLFANYVPTSWRSNLYYKLGGGGHTYARLQEADTTRNVDILVLGTSRVYLGYNPEVFRKKGIRIFDLATPLESVNMTEYLVNKYIDRLKPKYVIFDLYPDSFNGNTFESAVDIFSNSRVDKDLIRLSLKLNEIKVYNTLLYSAFRQTFNLDRNYQEHGRKGYDMYVKGGYVESYRVYQGDSLYHQSKYIINSKQLASFNAILRLFKKRHISYVLVQSPILRQKYLSYTNNAYIDSLFHRYGKYYNFNKVMNMPDTLLWDYNHLNTRGAVIYNEILIEALTADSQFRKLLK